MHDSIEEKVKNLEEWNEEREKIKPFVDKAIESHNNARSYVCSKDYKAALGFFKDTIKNYQTSLSLIPKYYLRYLAERIDLVIEEYINAIFTFKTQKDNLLNDEGIEDFLSFINSLDEEDKSYIEYYSIIKTYFEIAEFYYENGDFAKAYDFYQKVTASGCDRPFINKEVYFKMGEILFNWARFKEALFSFVSVLSFDKENKEVINHISDCLNRLGLIKYKDKFLSATPNEARKLIMEVL